MKYCEEYAALLDLFVDGELVPEDMKRVGDHLTGCPGCQAYVDDALAIRAGFPDIEDTAVPEGFAEGVMERVREASGRERKIVEMKRRGVRRWLGTAAALAACCALVVLVKTGPGGDTAAPAGNAACDITGVIESEGGEIAPQAAPEPKEDPSEDMPEEAVRAAPAARSKAAELYNDEVTLKAALAEAAPETAMDDERPPASEKTLYLTREEAGELLDGFAPIWESAVEWRYELNGEEYRTLLEALNRQEELPEEEEGPFLVVVSGPLE